MMISVRLVLLSAALAVILPVGVASAACNVPPGAATIKQELGHLLNAARRSQGLRPLSPSSALERAAQRQACDMAENGVASHRGSDGSDPRNRVRATGYCTRITAENIAWGQRSASSAVNWWMNSRGHRQNILLDRIDSFGVAVAQPDPRVGGGPRWVMVLARSC